MNINDFKIMKQMNKKISMVTCYDYWSAKIMAHPDTQIDCLLVGDSLAMVMHGHATTIPATMDLMSLHIRAVVHGAPNKFIIGDMPFLAARKSQKNTMENVQKLMMAGANAIKLEAVTGEEKLIEYIVRSGVPVIAHLGLTPQSVNQLGGFCVQGKTEKSAEQIIQHAKKLEDAGCFAIVLECIPAQLAKKITEQLSIPTIGIGAGSYVDGQVLILQDLLGLNPEFKPKFLKHFCDGFQIVQSALNQFNEQVKQVQYPAVEHCYK